MVGTTTWLSNRTSQQLAQAIAQPTRERTTDFISSINWSRLLPFWVVLTTVLLATTAVCGTVIWRAQTELKSAATELQATAQEIEALRHSNQQLQLEIERMSHDTSAIELAARERLGMVRPNDIVIPIESIKNSSSFGTVSFVR